MNNIKKFRDIAGLTQIELACAVNLSHQAISSYENGSREPNLETIKKLAKALNCKPTDLYPVLEG